MAQLSMNEMTTYRWSFEEDVIHYRAAGIGAIGVWRQKLADYGEERGIDLLHESEMEVSNLLWAGGFTGSDGHTYSESIKDAAEAIRTAAALRAECLVVYSGARNGHTQKHARRLFQDALNELVPTAAEHQVTLAIEPMHAGYAAEWTFLTDLDEAVALVDSFGSPFLRLAFDTYHLGHDPRIIERIGAMCRQIAIVHLGDSKRPPDHEQHRQRLGDGILPLAEIVAALSDAGYDGYYDVELVGEEMESCCYKKLIEASRRAFEDLIGARTP